MKRWILLFALCILLHGRAWSQGIAAGFPGDAGIEKDKRVVFAESFEDQSVEALKKRWDTVKNTEGMSFADDAPAAGGHSLLMAHTGGKGDSVDLYRRLPPGYEQLYVRMYVKFAPDCVPIHHFGTCVGGNVAATPWPSVKAGQPTDGAKSFWSGIEPFGSSWTWDFYTYWCEMRGSPPRGQTWGNSFVHDPALKVERGRWICVEQMIRMNDVGDTNGEAALWLDGKPIVHLKKGEPKGLWTFDKFYPGKGGEGIRWNHAKGDREETTVPAEGAPFEGFRWRTAKELNINYLWAYIYITKAPEGHVSRVWFDHFVAATEYIGPLVPPAGETRSSKASKSN